LEATACRKYKFSFRGFVLKAQMEETTSYEACAPDTPFGGACLAATVTAEALLK